LRNCARPRTSAALAAARLTSITAQISVSEHPSTSIRITDERCVTLSRMKVRRLALAIWRLVTASSWSAIMSTSSTE
jgi:hypothetical protein